MVASALRHMFLIGAVLLAASGYALGESYSDPSGFSFTYPDGWVAVNRAAAGNLDEELPPEIQEWFVKNNVNLNQVAVFLIRDGKEEFLENLNVVVEMKQIPVNDASVKAMASSLAKAYGEMGVNPVGVQSRIEKNGMRDVIVTEYEVRMPIGPDLLRQKQVMIPGGGKTYIVTCTAKADSFETYRPIFDGVVTSFQAPPPVETESGIARILKTGMLWGIVGGLIGLVIAVVKKLTG